MVRTLLVAIQFFSCGILAAGQFLNSKTLVIIDSIPLTEPGDVNEITAADVADITFITNADSLRLLGREGLDTVTYMFTKAYLYRPDSIKKIPRLEQMELKLGNRYLSDTLYSGRHIDYYINGQVQSEGILINGKLNGEETMYFRNGIKKSVTNYKNGMRDGICNDFYKNGQLMQTRLYKEDRQEKAFTTYFINGQVKEEIRPGKVTRYDTSLSWYSNGKLKAMALSKTGWFQSGKKQNKLDYYTSMFYEGLYTNNIKSANKYFFVIWLLDSAGIDTHFEEGLLLYNEFRFDLAITAFDIALQTEPYMMEALTYKALAQIKTYKYAHLKVADRNRDAPLSEEDVMAIPEEEQQQICNELLLADTIDAGDYYVKKHVPEVILSFCKTKSSE
jgi:antitoxin component YwqK of YwqJK toxin-antitoxin module